MPFITWIKTQFFEDKNHWILWIPVIFGCGVIFYFSFPDNSYLPPTLLFIGFLLLCLVFKDSPIYLFSLSAALFLSGFLWTKFYTEKIVYTPTIKQKFYATVIGEIDDIRPFYNPISKRTAYQITLKDLNLYKAGSLAGDVAIKKEKIKKDKKYKKRKSSKPYKRKPKKPKKDNKTVIRNYLNVNDYQEIDREFLAVDYRRLNQNWRENKYQNPPQKITLNVNTKLNGAKIGDVIQARAILEPFPKPYFSNGYNPAFENYFQGIGGTGFLASDAKILQSKPDSEFTQDIKFLRQKIAQKILDGMDEKTSGIAVALLVGSQNFIDKNILNEVRISGLAHLLSISGLHFTLAAGIFFFSIRFLLSLNQNLTLNYDIKKIAGVIAIFGGLFYLLLSGAPVPALRAFIVITLVFIAILLDLRPNAFRSCALAALVILIFSPNAIFSPSFQLSFAAILSLIVLADYTKKYHINSSERSFFAKLQIYFLSIILSSICATIATTPFSIYYFNQYSSYSVLANLLAIPIASFITMPFGFLAIFLMPLGIEKLPLIPMQFSIDWIIQIAHFTANLPFSYLTIKSISNSSFGLIIFGILWFGLWQKTWRYLAILPIIFGIYLAYKTPIPYLLIDEKKKIFAFYDHQKLIFSKPTKSKQAKLWAKKLGLEEFYNVDDLSNEEKEKLQLDCNKDYCQLFLGNKKILTLLNRNKISQICDENYDVVINLTHKYQLPECVLNAEIVIDNEDLKRDGNYFLYF